MLICIFNKNLKQPFLDAPPLFNAFLIRKLRGEVFDGDRAFSAGNNMRVTVVSEGSDNNSYHLQVRVRLIHCIFDILVLCKRIRCRINFCSGSSFWVRVKENEKKAPAKDVKVLNPGTMNRPCG